MGYRSEVVLGITKDCYNEHATKELKEALKDCDYVFSNEDNYFFKWETIKWYEDCPEIQTIEKFISDMKRGECSMIRIGEEDNDIERKGDPYEMELYVQRTVDLPKVQDEDVKMFFAENSIKFIKNS